MPRARRFFAALTLCLAVLGASACDSNDPDFEIEGTYSGITEESGTSRTTLNVEIPATESGESFTFEGTVVERGGFDEVISTIFGTGTYDHPSLTLTVQGETTDGTVSDDGGTITLDIEGDTTVLRRQ